MANSISDKIKNHKSMGVVHDSTVNVENKKKLSFETVLHAAQHVPPPNTINGNTHSVAIKPNPATIHRGFQHTEPLIPEITSSTTLLPLKTIITPFINNAITTIAITTPYASDNIITTSNSIDTDNSDITDTATITTTTTTGTTIIATTTTIKVTATTKTITSPMQFIPIPIEMLVREWNTTTKDSELSIQHQNYTLNIGILEQELNNRQMIRNGLIKELKCFHYFAN
ncbi:unnamed protein product, partial [Brugia timori]|uniref:Uncharacterized protein n=1 Tax=Brugia timori TaxID=42155 RepID=A0A0R3RBL7_9BILA